MPIILEMYVVYYLPLVLNSTECCKHFLHQLHTEALPRRAIGNLHDYGIQVPRQISCLLSCPTYRRLLPKPLFTTDDHVMEDDAVLYPMRRIRHVFL
jgi:hypothetical protein